MKRLVSLILTLVMLLSISTTAFAVFDETSNDVPDEIRGAVLYEYAFEPENSASINVASSQAMGIATVSYTEDDTTGSLTTYQYFDGKLAEEHTTIRGSGIVHHKYYQEDGTILTNTEITATTRGTNIPDYTTERQKGYIYYQTSMTGTQYAIRAYVREGYFENKPLTIREGTAKTFADWVSFVASMWAYSCTPALGTVVSMLNDFGVIEAVAGGLYRAAFTRTYTCDFVNTEWHGEATKPSTNYPEGFLEGTYATLNTGDVVTEGYTIDFWRSNNLGLEMLYQVFGISELPTGWSDIG